MWCVYYRWGLRLKKVELELPTEGRQDLVFPGSQKQRGLRFGVCILKTQLAGKRCFMAAIRKQEKIMTVGVRKNAAISALEEKTFTLRFLLGWPW